jgi:tetratricopeptide (TPR) repeat protein
MLSRLTVIFCAGLLVACANPINQKTTLKYYMAGENALGQGNLPLAKEYFSRALINTQIGHLGPEAEAEVALKLGQVLGNMCEHDAAERIFMLALSRKEAAHGANSASTAIARVELAQFNFDIGRYEKAVAYFDTAFAVSGAAREASSPGDYALLLDDYAVAATQLGRPQAAAQATAKAAQLRQAAAASGASAGRTDYIRYPKSCPGGTTL